eukprot:TRINITY_DN255_c2_g3_i1.p1 TRINITY_DN255_c2_g3~~TRINITY_DN255_c2_g3_i1.p1  ORF type:complete len:105 (-),score=23.74 TRINITY_DN255_c2_g3_i1:53-367(-)
MSGRPQGGSPAQPNKAKAVQAQVDEVKDIMHNNIDIMIKNHEKVENLQDKTEQMSSNAKQFKKQAAAVHRHMWWRNCKLQIIIAVIIIAVLLVIIVPLVLRFKK